MSLSEEQVQILCDGKRGDSIEFEDAKHGLCTVVRGKVGYTVRVASRIVLPPLQLSSGSTQSLTEESEQE